MKTDNAKRRTVGIWLPTLLWLAATIADQFFSKLLDKFAEFLSPTIEYTTLLQIALLLLVLLVSLYIHHRNYINALNTSDVIVQSPKNVAPRSQRDVLEHQKELLANLASDEKYLLSKYMDQDVKSLEFHPGHSTANGLKQKGILSMPSQMMNMFSASYTLNDWAWKLLKNNPQYLMGIKGDQSHVDEGFKI